MKNGKEFDDDRVIEDLVEAIRLTIQYLDERDGTRSRPNPIRELLATRLAEAEARRSQ